MEKIQEINDVCKEVLTILAYTDNSLIEQIPEKVFNKLQEFAADSNVEFFINSEIDLNDQDISDECKDFISLLYYSYIANEDEKKELAKMWNMNEEKYQQELQEKYNSDNIFKKVNTDEFINVETPVNNTNTALIEYKESFFTKFKNFIFKILHINNNLN